MISAHDPKAVLDLTKPIDSSLPIFRDGEYSDPPFACAAWSSIAARGYLVSRIELGTQTGTHMDAPAHFFEGGATLEQLSPAQMFGAYYLVNLPRKGEALLVDQSLVHYAGQPILFVRATEGDTIVLSRQSLDRLLEVPVALWVLAGEIEVSSSPRYEFHRCLARAGKFLVEDLDTETARKVPTTGEVFALPLRLIGTSGSPCRVLVRGSGTSG